MKEFITLENVQVGSMRNMNITFRLDKVNSIVSGIDLQENVVIINIAENDRVRLTFSTESEMIMCKNSLLAKIIKD